MLTVCVLDVVPVSLSWARENPTIELITNTNCSLVLNQEMISISWGFFPPVDLQICSVFHSFLLDECLYFKVISIKHVVLAALSKRIRAE